MREQGIEEQLVDEEELYGRYIAEDIVDPENGEIHAEAGEEITKEMLERPGEVGAKSLQTPAMAQMHMASHMRNMVGVHPNETSKSELSGTYRVVRRRVPRALSRSNQHIPHR